MVTVEEIWKWALPPGTQLLGGREGLAREVTWAIGLRPRPPGFEGIRGGEIALLSVPGLKQLGPRLGLAQALERLAEIGVAAVATVGETNPEAIAAADSFVMPLLALPESTSLSELERTVNSFIFQRRAELHHITQQASLLMELAIQGKGIPAIAERLAAITGRGVAVEDGGLQLRLLVPAPGMEQGQLAPLLEEGGPALREQFARVNLSASDPPTTRLKLSAAGLGRLAAPIVARERPWGYLSVIGPSDVLWEGDRVALARAAAACAIELAREHAVIEAQDQLQAHLLDDILSGSYANSEAAVERGRRLGYDLTIPYGVVAFHLADPALGPKRVIALVERELARLKLKAPFKVQGDLITLLYPLPAGADGPGFKGLADGLRRALAQALGDRQLSGGLGRLHPGLEGLSIAYEEAEQALHMSLRLFGTGALTYFGDLGIYRLLFSMNQSPDLATFYQETLGALVEHDRKSSSQLLKTLEAYFSAGGSPTEAAERLHLHRNTLLYRLKRIREITGLNLDDAETRLALHLALRVGDMLAAAQEG